MVHISYSVSDISSTKMLNSNIVGRTTSLNDEAYCTCNNSSVSNSNFDNLINMVLQMSLANTFGSNIPMGISGSTMNAINNSTINSSNTNSTVNNGYVGSIQNVSTSVEGLTTQQRIDRAILSASQKYGVDASLIKAIIKTESNFKPNVTSKAGAMGLMQIMPSNAKALNISNPYNIEENIDGGTRFFKSYLDKYNGNAEMALMAYNGGPTRMAKRGVKSINDIYKMPKETQKYVPKVMNYYRDYKSYSL